LRFFKKRKVVLTKGFRQPRKRSGDSSRTHLNTKNNHLGMSNVTLIIVAYGRMKVAQAHWRTIKLLIEHGFDVAWKEESLEPELDAGYIMLDYNTCLAVNAQTAFALRLPENWQTLQIT
jgi:hypothetical protein